MQLKELRDLTEGIVKNLEDEHLIFKTSLIKKQLDLSKVVKSKAGLKESLLN
jgi:hypothetical protein